MRSVDAGDLEVSETVWSREQKCLTIAKMAQDCGIQILTLHGRTRRRYKGEAEYDTIRAVKAGGTNSGGGQW